MTSTAARTRSFTPALPATLLSAVVHGALLHGAVAPRERDEPEEPLEGERDHTRSRELATEDVEEQEAHHRKHGSLAHGLGRVWESHHHLVHDLGRVREAPHHQIHDKPE